MRWVIHKGPMESRLEVWLVCLRSFFGRGRFQKTGLQETAVFEHRLVLGSGEGKLSMEEEISGLRLAGQGW